MSGSIQSKTKGGIAITPYTHEHVDAVKAFNARLRAGGVLWPFPESHIPGWLPYVDGREIYHEYYVAADQEAVHGAYMLRRQPFWVAGQRVSLSQYRLPLSEGQIDKRFAALGVQLYLDAVRKQKMLYTVGIGGYQEAFAQLLISAGWKTFPVPFYFRVFRPKPFLRNIAYLRTTTLRRLALDAMAASGLGSVAVHAYQAMKSRRPPHLPAVEFSEENGFGAWADEVWEAAKPDYSLIGVRDSTILNILYPPDDARFGKLKIMFQGEVIGWAAVLNVTMQDHNYFGNMRVGSLIDCLAVPGMEEKVVFAASRYLKRHGAEIFVTNLSHHRWQAAAESQGLCQATSNFIFAASKPLVALIDSVDGKMERVYMNRGDGYGREHLLAARK